MRRLLGCLLILLLAGATVVVAERPENPGNSGGKPRPADDLYGDLVIVERDPDTGEPWTDDEGCVRPLDADCAYIPLLYESGDPIPEEDDPCEVDPLYAEFLQEIDLGRLSVTRSTQDVMDQAYSEAIKRINEADDLGFDPAGRLNYCQDSLDSFCAADGGEWRTIDSPLENLAMYQKLLRTGSLEGVENPDVAVPEHLIDFENLDDPDTLDLDRAASFLAAAADKTSFVTSDAIVTVNTFLGVNIVTPGENPRDDATIDYFSFAGYQYDQFKCYPAHTNTMLLVPFPESWTCPDEVEPMQCFYADIVLLSNHTYLFKNLGFCDAEVSVPYDPMETGGLLQFTQAVEHSRSVIGFLHNWSLPEM